MIINYKFIVAHYNEDLEWVKKEAENLYIYHKGDEQKPRFDCYNWEKLPNVGREGHTYLYHIIKNYNNLADINIFLQGNISDHKDLCPPNIEDYYLILNNSKVSFYCKSIGIMPRLKHVYHIGVFKERLDKGNLAKAKDNFYTFFEKNLGYKMPKYLCVSYGACFSIKKELILKHSIDFYKKLLYDLSQHPDPEEGHYLERLWVSIFNIDNKIISKNKKIYKILRYKVSSLKQRLLSLF